jgi:dihydrodipicolinate synthase/N-acetylneuraminate lyase
MTVELRGCYPILATPFLSHGDIDDNSVVRLLKHLMLAELDRLVGRIAGRLHPAAP